MNEESVMSEVVVSSDVAWASTSIDWLVTEWASDYAAEGNSV